MSDERTVERDKDLPAEQKPQPLTISPIAKDKTYGEKAHGFIFGQLLNYWANLFASAGFSFWAAHSHNPIRLPGMRQAATPHAIQTNLARGVEKAIRPLSFVKNAPGAARAVAEALTLLLPGFIIVVPSVWLGEKFKAPIVRFFDRRHYGKDSENDPTLQARHALVEGQEKPTFLGTLVARFLSMGVVQVTALTVGNRKNLMPRFKGVTPVSGDVGNIIGDGVHSMAPEMVGKFNAKIAGAGIGKRLGNVGYSWSQEQITEYPKIIRAFAKGTEKGHYLPRDLKLAEKIAAGKPYDNAMQDMVRFVAMDTIYTLLTAVTVKPFVQLIRHVPGMTYKPKVSEPTQQSLATLQKVKPRHAKSRMSFAPDIAADALPTAPLAAAPTTSIGNIEHHDRVKHAHEQELQQ